MRPLVHEKPDWVAVYGDLKKDGFKNSILGGSRSLITLKVFYMGRFTIVRGIPNASQQLIRTGT